MRKRKLNRKARRAMSVFSLLVVGSLAGFGLGVRHVMAARPAAYPVAAASVVYDTGANLVSMTAPGSVSRGWNGQWELTLEDGAGYELGENNVLFHNGVVQVLGGGYRVLEDSSVERLSSYSEMTPGEDAAFYKLADRRYLIVA